MVTINPLPSLFPDEPKSHYVGNPPTGFLNPWPSFPQQSHGLMHVFKTRFARDKPPFKPVPDRSELVQVQKIDFAYPDPGFKVTWIGHASFLLQTSTPAGASRGLNILCDPLFSERTSPVTFLGPKRYNPAPCTIHELLDNIEVDLILISHNHYDHADAQTLKAIYANRKDKVHILVGLHSSRWLVGHGISRSCITEVDWWDQFEVQVEDVGSVKITCTPSQHFSGRSPFDRDYDLWCSFAIEELQGDHKKLYFSGDTAYRGISDPNLTHEEEESHAACPAFKQIGDALGPFDLSLLPIGLCEPRVFMSPVHANPWDSIHIHKDVKSKKSIGMHYGTVRGGLSQYYEDVRAPPKNWQEAANAAGLKWGEEIGLVNIGETLVLN